MSFKQFVGFDEGFKIIIVLPDLARLVQAFGWLALPC